MFTYYTIIGKDLNLFRGHVENIKTHAGFNKISGEKEFLAIVYTNDSIPKEVTQDILTYCDQQSIRTVIYKEPTSVFIENLYACWNLGYEHSKSGFVFRGGSDQVFSKDSFFNLYNVALKYDVGNNNIILQANTIENEVTLNKIGAKSRHFAKAFGSTFEEFDMDKFEEFCATLNTNVNEDILTIEECLKYWGYPTKLAGSLLGKNVNRPDGCSWLMTRADWEKFGPMPATDRHVTGDVAIHDYMQRAGYKSRLVRDCITYHFVQGESLNIQSGL